MFTPLPGHRVGRCPAAPPPIAPHDSALCGTCTQVPVVIRGPGGVGRQLGAEHSQRLESYFQSIPGVQLVACSTVANAKALLKSAIRSDNPIIFFEHVLLYNVKGAFRGGAVYELLLPVK